MQFQTKKSMLSISTTLSGVISHARLFVTGQLRNPWQMLTEPLGSAEPRLKNTEVLYKDEQCQKWRITSDHGIYIFIYQLLNWDI